MKLFLATGRPLRAILAGNLAVQALSWIVIVRALALGIVPMQNAGAVVIHTMPGAGFLYFLWRSDGITIQGNATKIPHSR